MGSHRTDGRIVGKEKHPELYLSCKGHRVHCLSQYTLQTHRCYYHLTFVRNLAIWTPDRCFFCVAVASDKIWK